MIDEIARRSQLNRIFHNLFRQKHRIIVEYNFLWIIEGLRKPGVNFEWDADTQVCLSNSKDINGELRHQGNLGLACTNTRKAFSLHSIHRKRI